MPVNPKTRRLPTAACSWLAASISGGILTLCLPPWNVSWLCWFALTPLIGAVWAAVGASLPGDSGVLKRGSRWLEWVRSPLARAAGLGYAAGLVFFWTAFSWLTTVTAGGWFVLGLYHALYFAFWSWFLGCLILALGRWLGAEVQPQEGSGGRAAPLLVRRGAWAFVSDSGPSGGAKRAIQNWALRSRWNLILAAGASSAWVAQEWVRGWMFSGFGWNDVGVMLHGTLPLIQLAEFTGVGGLSFVVVFVNLIAVATVWRLFLEIRRGKMRPHFDFTLTLAALMAAFAHGVYSLPRPGQRAPEGTVSLRIAAVQAAIPQREKWSAEFERRTFDEYTTLTDRAIASKPDLLLWPEAATPQEFLNERKSHDFVMGFARRGDFSFLLGTVDSVLEPDVPVEKALQHDYNAAVLLTGTVDRESPQIYYKTHLVPFGEYIPMRHSFPLFGWIAGNQVPSDFDAGGAPVVFQMENPSLRLAPTICFEDTLGDLVRHFVLPQADGAAGAQLLVNLTNDGWFHRSAASEQQLDEAVFRTVENRRPMVRCANTGVTCVVNAFGRVEALLQEGGDTFAPGVLVAQVQVPPANAPLTFYTRHGEVFSEGCASLTAGVILVMALARARRRRRPPLAPAQANPPPALAAA